MEGIFSYQLHDDQVLATPMIMPSQKNNFNIEESMFGNLSNSSSPNCYLSEALAPYQNIASPDPASNNTSTVIDAKSDSSFSMVIDTSQTSVNHSPNYRRIRAKDGSSSRLTPSEGKVRRQILSERMTILQSLVPGCDKVIGKAQVLDVIINYVQSLQNQIEFLSMRLASMDQCMLSKYSFDQDQLIEIQEISGMTCEQVPRGGFEQQNMANISELTDRDIDDCLMMIYSDSSPSNLFQPHGLELDHATTFSQAVGSAHLGQFAEPGQGLLNQVELDDIL